MVEILKLEELQGTNEVKKDLKPIELVKYLDTEYMWLGATAEAKEFKKLILLDDDYGEYDLILVINPYNTKILYLGHWNDGVIDNE